MEKMTLIALFKNNISQIFISNMHGHIHVYVLHDMHVYTCVCICMYMVYLEYSIYIIKITIILLFSTDRRHSIAE